MKLYLFIITCLILCNTCLAQVKDDFYKSFSSSERKEHTLNFENDSIARFQNVGTHRSQVVKIYGKYRIQNDTVFIQIPKLKGLDSIDATKHKLFYLSESLIKLIKRKTELLDNNTNTVYVMSHIFNKNRIRRKVLRIIDNKKYIVDIGITNSYGLIESDAKPNKKFLKAYLLYTNDIENYNTEYIAGLTAYIKFGLIGINGVLLIEEKTTANSRLPQLRNI